MDFLSSILAGIGGFIAGFVGHITAHDFCAVVPKWSKALIVAASQRVAPSDRARYQEEWLADLEERPTIFSKLKHAFGCFGSAWKMRRQAAEPRIKYRIEFIGSGSVEINGETLVAFSNVISGISFVQKMVRKTPKFARASVSSLMMPPILKIQLSYALRKSKRRDLDLPTLRQAIEFVSSKQTTALRGYVDGELVFQGRSPNNPPRQS